MSDTGDPRYTAILQDDSMPWPVVFHFVVCRDEDSGKVFHINSGFEIGDVPEPTPSGQVTFDRLPPAIDPATIRRIADSWDLYLDVARNAVTLELSKVKEGVTILLAPKNKKRAITDDFLRHIAGQYRTFVKAGTPPVRGIADHWHADISTASRWVKRAREAGFIDVEDGV